MLTVRVETADVIRQYNPALAERWLRDPFARVDIARAFAAGFKPDKYGDLPTVAWVVIRASLADQKSRAAS